MDKPPTNPGTLDHWASVQPERIALREGDRTLTWAQWKDRSDRLAASLETRGLGPGDIVVVRTQIRIEWAIIAAALGALKCSLLALNWRLTATESRYVMNNSRAHAIFCDDPQPAGLLPAFEGQSLKLAVSIDVPAEGFENYADLFGDTSAHYPDIGDPPLIVYTSGTTGLPKGVVMNQAVRPEDPVHNEYLLDVRSKRQSGTDAVFLLTMPLHHGSGPSQLWAGKRSGCLVVMLPRFDPLTALALIERHRVTHWTGVPTMFKRIAGLRPEVVEGFDLSSLQQLTVGAAPVSTALKEWIIEHLGDCLHEGYGSTETGMVTHMTPEMQLAKPGSSGRPYRHVLLEIRDDTGAPVAPGEVGEIWACTPVVIGNYLNGPPLGDDTIDARGYFRTGDMGRIDTDGYLYISDRAKDMIISGGVNLYPAEIEAALQTHPAVQDAAVIGIPDDEFGESVLAFCELKAGHIVDESALMAHCVRDLASYKRPRSIRIVSELPRNTVGKLLKRDLRAPFWKHKERQV